MIVHALVAGAGLVVLALRPAPGARAVPVVMEIVRGSVPAAPLVPAVPERRPTEAASVARPAAAPRRAPAPRVLVAPAPAAALAVPEPDPSLPEARSPYAASVGDASGVTFAPPPPPPPPPPREIVRAEAEASFVDSGFTRLSTLVVSWQHHERVSACLERELGSGERLARLSQGAKDRMLAAVQTGDHAAALAEARRLHGAAESFDALYARARRCLDR